MTARGRRATVVGVVGAVVALGVAACGSGTAGSDSDDAANNPTVATSSSSGSDSGGTTCTADTMGYPKITDLKGVKVGFSQSEPAAAAFRLAETQSMKDEAKKQGAILLDTNANSKPDKQISDIKDLLTKGVKLLIVAPLNSDGLQPALDAAAQAKVPVVTVDRQLNATPCKDYITFIGSNFVQQGQRAADAMIKATGGKGNIVVLLGTSGNGVTTDRLKGFVDEVKAKAPDLKIVAQQTGNFDRQNGQKVMAQLLQAHPDLTGVYAENDEMGVGAKVAISAAGKQPGKDVKIVSIDGTKDAVSALAAGQYNGVIQSNPRFGPLAFQALKDFESFTGTDPKITIVDDAYTPENAKSKLGSAF